MEESSTEILRKDRKTGFAVRKIQKQKRNVIFAVVIATVLCVSLLLIFLLPQKSVYRTLCDNGYTGTQEQLIASLVGEEKAPQGDTAYKLATENGYKKTKADWIKTLTGAKEADESLSTYQIACKNGYEGDLTQWLNHIADNPETLGKSKDGNSTDYELACEYGFMGTFIEWLVSLSSEPIY